MQREARILATLILVVLLAGTAFSSGYVDNYDGKFDGRYRAKAQNRTQGSERYRVVARISGDDLAIEFADGEVRTRIVDIYDWSYEVEFTCRARNTGDRWKVTVDKQ